METISGSYSSCSNMRYQRAFQKPCESSLNAHSPSINQSLVFWDYTPLVSFEFERDYSVPISNALSRGQRAVSLRHGRITPSSLRLRPALAKWSTRSLRMSWRNVGHGRYHGEKWKWRAKARETPQYPHLSLKVLWDKYMVYQSKKSRLISRH